MKHANSFRDLEVYQLARRLAQEIFQTSKAFPTAEMYSLTDQIRRSSRSVGAQISEVWGKRRYEKHFVSKLTDADGEQVEKKHWIESASGCSYITPQQREQWLELCTFIGRMLHGMTEKADRFCSVTDYWSPITDQKMRHRSQGQRTLAESNKELEEV